jgi:adenine deaminase
MKIMLRYGSAWHDVAEGVKAITEAGLDSRRFILCTDDSHSETLVSEGHVNRAVRQAILNGVPALKAYQMATLNPAEHFGVSKEVGMLAAGRYADVLVFDELETVNPCLVFTRGRLVASNGELSIDIPEYSYPESAKNSVKLARKINRDDFVIHLPTSNLTSLVDSKFRANVIGIIENQAPTRHLQLDVTIHQGRIDADINQDLAKVAVIERHHGSGRIQLGLVSGFGLKLPCGIASTVAHDCHHIVVIGTSDADMAVAANTLAEIGGGQVVVYEGKVIGLVPLPIAGLMSDQHAHTVARQAASVLEGFRYCGCQINNPNMQLSLLALVVIPELRISDLGLVDVTNFKLIPLIETE